MQRRIVAKGVAAPEPRCWPHHFDLATLTSFPGADGATAYVGAGLSPGDGYYDEPYFYISLYPAPDVAGLPALPAPGHWHNHEFTAAVATARSVNAGKDQAGDVEAFLDFAIDTAISALGARAA
jgi:hypothetical protein